MKKFFKIFFASIFSLLFLLIIIFNKNIPAFIYNEMEVKGRFYFYLSEEGLKMVYQLIDIRTGKSEIIVSDEDKLYKIKEEIDKALKNIVGVSDLQTALINRQEKIPFLSEKYKKYHEMKKVGLDNYQKSLVTLKDVKTKEHITFDLLSQVVFLGESMGKKEKNEENYWIKLGENANIAKEIIDRAEKLYDDKFLDEGYRNYLVTHAQKVIDVYNLAADPGKTKDMESFEKDLQKIYQKGNDLNIEKIYAEWQKNIINDLNKELEEYKEKSYQQLDEADKYYRENNLGNDLVSRFLSIFNKKFPRNI